MAESESRVVIFGALGANLAIAVAKFFAASVTGSAAMLAEGIHSTVDTVNEILLLVGTSRSRRPADPEHPFGHGKEIYFWGLVVAMLLFSLGGGFSIYEGIVHIQEPAELESPSWNYAVLAIAFVAESISWLIARHKLKKVSGETNLWRAARSSKDPSMFLVLGEDTAAIAGIVIAFLGLLFRELFDLPILDGVASLLIGLVLCAMAAVLSWHTRGLLIGASVDDETERSIQRIVCADPAVSGARRPLTMYLGPDDVLLNLDIEFRQEIDATEVTAAVDRIEAAIRNAHPEIRRIYLEAESLRPKAEKPQPKSV